MSSGQHAEELATKAAEAVRRVVAEAEDRAAEIVRDAEAKAGTIREQAEAEAKQIRERAEADARGQIEAAKRALDELGGTLVAAATEAIPLGESQPPEPEPQPEPEPETPSESQGAPEAPISPPAEEVMRGGSAGEAEEPPVSGGEAAPETGNGDDAAERLLALKLAVEGEDPAAIEAELIQKFGPGDRSDLLRDVVNRATR